MTQQNTEIHQMILAEVREVKAEVKLTNGRLRILERWRDGLAGGVAVLTALILPVVLAVATNIIEV